VRHEKAQLVQSARRALGSVIGAGEEDVALLNSTTEGINIVLSGLGLGPEDEVITSNLEHSSIIVPCYEVGRRTGAKVTVVRSSAQESADELAALFEAAIAESRGRAKVIALSHISFNRGTRLPVERIIRAGHDAGAYVLLDGAQSAGQIEVGVDRLDADFYAIPAHKFVLGPDAAGALYVRPQLLERVQALSVAHPAAERYDFDGSYQPRLSAVRKFEMATHSGSVLAGVVEAVRVLRDAGIEEIERRILGLASRLVDGLQAMPNVTMRSPLDAPLRSGLVTFTIGSLEPNQACAALWQLRRVVGRVVGDKRVRLSIAPFNDESDIDAALEGIEQLATRGLPPDAMTAERYKELLAEDDD
jgi:L-cysteine/cystine lyase